MTDHAERSVYVTWRHPEGSIHPVGLLTRYVSNGSESYRFVYLKKSESLEDFPCLSGLPDLHRVYESEHLFAVFRNRQMSRRRPDYERYVKKLNLEVDSDPFEVMARSGGRRSTDRIEVFAPPTRTTDGNLTTQFFVRGIRHREGAMEAVSGLQPGDLLELKDEPDNAYNPRAVLVRTVDGKDVGWVPDYFVEMVHDLRRLAGTEAVSIAVEHVNPPDVAPSMRLICRLTAPWPDGYARMAERPEFELIGS